MKQIVYSDTEYFYSNIREMLKNFHRIKILSDYKKTADIPQGLLYLLRLDDKNPYCRTKKFIEDAVIPGHPIEIGVDKFDRLTFTIHSMYSKM